MSLNVIAIVCLLVLLLSWVVCNPKDKGALGFLACFLAFFGGVLAGLHQPSLPIYTDPGSALVYNTAYRTEHTVKCGEFICATVAAIGTEKVQLLKFPGDTKLPDIFTVNSDDKIFAVTVPAKSAEPARP